MGDKCRKICPVKVLEYLKSYLSGLFESQFYEWKMRLETNEFWATLHPSQKIQWSNHRGEFLNKQFENANSDLKRCRKKSFKLFLRSPDRWLLIYMTIQIFTENFRSWKNLGPEIWSLFFLERERGPNPNANPYL